jgi:arginase
MAKMVFIGVPYWLGKKDEYSGVVEIVRDSGIASEFGAEWVDIAPQFSDDEHPVISVNRAIAEAIQAHHDAIPMIMAGDCTACVGAMKGLEAQSPHVLWYDAHGDYNTPETSPSGFLGGMPLAAMVGRGSQWMLEGVKMTPIAEERVVLIDARDLDPEEAQLVRESKLTHLPDVADVDGYAWDNASIYLHFDGDIIRLEDHPAVNYPAEGGPTLEASIASIQSALQQANVAGFFVTLWNDSFEGADKSRQALMQVIRSAATTIQSL